jgi:hypothetical protein
LVRRPFEGPEADASEPSIPELLELFRATDPDRILGRAPGEGPELAPPGGYRVIGAEERKPELEQLSPRENARECIRLEEQLRQLQREDPGHRAWRALMLSPTVDVWIALLAGERVPADRLDQAWLERFGRRGE